MTILEFVTRQRVQGINKWIELINANGLESHEGIILQCADEMGLISVNFEKSLKSDLMDAINV